MPATPAAPRRAFAVTAALVLLALAGCGYGSRAKESAGADIAAEGAPAVDDAGLGAN
ncbi:hypothetical protein GCM10027073_31230 [Streptomyces chlorus]|uniref:Lipoprotein n=1 Tax=Streptomyces chlorus TaxID=887452 RepID=A0ABW1E6V7_9ACTN